ncbi:MAG: Hsp20/alpha crystallin family protein [Patescibacteria group bacterium]|nr:Hsp20/alpha crystallin family protein [Patescibacteria group bacterium]MBU2509630.1 Hsp20/alpha crystallin family protein [Patescibacteria group bacterium]
MSSTDLDNQWFHEPEEGQLSVDVFRDDNELVVRSPVAGVKVDDIDISVHGDLLTIRGKRESKKDITEDDWYYRECYWGSFSRSIVLPHQVESDNAKASFKNGVLEVRIPIKNQGKKVKVEWKK